MLQLSGKLGHQFLPIISIPDPYQKTMNREEQIKDYNYADFDDNALGHVMKWAGNQPELGKRAPDFPLWKLEEDGETLTETTLLTVIKENPLTIVEFGSFS